MTVPDDGFAQYSPPEGYSVERQFKNGLVAYVLRRVSDKYTVGIFDNLADVNRSARADVFEVERRDRRLPLEVLADQRGAQDPISGGPVLDNPV